MNFITKTWLEENIDWNKLNGYATEATDAIHDTYFYEFVGRQLTELDGYASWEIINSKFKKQVNDYHFLKNERDDYSEIEVWLRGEIDIEFFAENGHSFFKRTDFGTIMNLGINKQRILEYDFRFFPEESGLDFDKFVSLIRNLVSADGS